MGSPAASVAQDKLAHPGRYCPEPRCLWRTGDGSPCPRHGGEERPNSRFRAEHIETRKTWGDLVRITGLVRGSMIAEADCFLVEVRLYLEQSRSQRP